MGILDDLGAKLTRHELHSALEEYEDDCLECTSCHCCGKPFDKHGPWFNFSQKKKKRKAR